MVTSTPEADAVATVRALFYASGLPASDVEIAGIAKGYPGLRAGINALYDVPGARYSDPAMRFLPDVGTSPDWAD
ncbi:hypothetical protein WL86_29855 [Burkholderia diffusa]|nr:hypothetical protein WL86_29855 [Burkholderia diffusa]